jgi:meso-butanediol dehydrogenase/(S,S)-butanediol dehydrogenase/diacetyl reductase
MTAARRSTDGPVTLVVGGASGIGLATTELLLSRGGRLLVLGLAGDDLDRVARELSVQIAPGDAADPEVARQAVNAAIATWGRVDALVCCAGIGTFGTVTDATDVDWDRVIRANLMTAIQPARHALPHLVASGGAIVLISSLAGVQAVPASATYSVTKHALVGLARSMATDFGPLGVRTNVVCPGPVRTSMFDDVMGQAADQLGIDKASAYLRAASLNPRRKLATPTEIAQVIAFLAGPESAAVNGAVLLADGGISAADLSMSALHQPADRSVEYPAASLEGSRLA